METRFLIKVIPNAKTNQIVGEMGDGTIKIRIKAKPIEGKANLQLVKYLQGKLGIRPGDISIISGEKNRLKTILVKKMSIEQIKILLFSSQDEP